LWTVDAVSRTRMVEQLPVGEYNQLYRQSSTLYFSSTDKADETTIQSLSLDPLAQPSTVSGSTNVKTFTIASNVVLGKFASGLWVGTPVSSPSWIQLPVSSLHLDVDPQLEWRAMFRDAWRLLRDYFYDPGMHGVDWGGVYQRYLPLVRRVTTHGELKDLIAQMVGEVSALHVFVYGGDDVDTPKGASVASLAVELRRNESGGGYTVGHIPLSDPAVPNAAPPLSPQRANVSTGETLLAIDGLPLLALPDIGFALQGKADRLVQLTVRSPAGDTRLVTATPVSQGTAFKYRYNEWELLARRRVDLLSNGRVGYIHMRRMSQGGHSFERFAAGFYPEGHKDGLIIDVRNNHGGNIDSWVLTKLMRRAWMYWKGRSGPIAWNQHGAFRGHMVVLVDEKTASDGEAFAEGFRRLGLGVVMGQRTWGGEIWLSSDNPMVDGGIATAPESGVFSLDGKWLIEQVGVVPDIEVVNEPVATFYGADAQLDAAIRHLNDQIALRPIPEPTPPAYPDRSLPAGQCSV